MKPNSKIAWENPEIARQVLAHSTEAILVIQDERLEFCNPKGIQLLGLKGETWRELVFLDRIHPQDQSAVRDRQRLLLTGRRARTDGSFRLRHNDNHHRLVQSTEIAIVWRNQPAVLALLSDLTPLKALENELRQAQKMKTLGTLVAGVAHEINNPINLVMYNISILQKIWHDLLPLMAGGNTAQPRQRFGGLSSDYLKDNLPQLLADTDLAVQRVAKIVKDLKNFSRLEDVHDTRIMQVNTAVENAIRLGRAVTQQHGATFETQLAADLPMMEGNPQSMEQVVLNLIINAAQATDQGTGRIAIQTRFQNRGGRILIEVADNGPGIDSQVQERIYQPFVTTKQHQGGTGLGLSVAYNVVAAHGGTITAQNLPGGGTRFAVSLPALLRPLKILITDDDESVRDLYQIALTQKFPCEIAHAVNGIEACITLGGFMPDLLVLDMLMPEMDGLEVCRTIKRTPSLERLKVLITTGFPHHPKINSVYDLGFKVIHYKGDGLGGFLEAVNRILAQ
jgi:PAS domain S-box-containing protein